MRLALGAFPLLIQSFVRGVPANTVRLRPPDEVEDGSGDYSGAASGNGPDLHHVQQYREYLTPDVQVFICSGDGVALPRFCLTLAICSFQVFAHALAPLNDIPGILSPMLPIFVPCGRIVSRLEDLLAGLILDLFMLGLNRSRQRADCPPPSVVMFVPRCPWRINALDAFRVDHSVLGQAKQRQTRELLEA
eukprot:g35162.t1